MDAPEQQIPPVEIIEDEPENPPAPVDPPVEDPPEPPDDAAATEDVIEPEDIEAAQAAADEALARVGSRKGFLPNRARKMLNKIKELLDELEKEIDDDGIPASKLTGEQAEAVSLGDKGTIKRALAKLDEWLS